MQPLPLQNALNLYGQQIGVYDAIITRVNGRDSKIKQPDRFIFGSIQVMSPKESKLLSDGAISSGDLVLYTRDMVHQVDVTQAGNSNLQTYVRYEGNIWKTNIIGTWQDKNGGSNRYHLTRYTNIDEALQ